MTHFPQGTSARPRSRAGIITRTGADWINPPAPLSQWQRDRASAPFAQPHPERWWHSLALWLGVIAFPPCTVLLFIAFMETPHAR